MQIGITIQNKIAKRDDPNAFIVCGNSDYTIKFTFDEEWKAYEAKTARFYSNGEPEDVVFTGDECPVPVMVKADGVFVGVFAGDLRTTTKAYIPCERSILCLGGKVKEPTPDVYAQLMEQINSGIIKGDKGDKGDAFTYEDFTEKQLADLKIEPAIVYGNYETMINAFNAMPNDLYKAGLNVLIVTLYVPDLWISSVEETAVEYTYTSDEDFANDIKANGYIQIGYYKLSALETHKVDLTDYVKFTDYPVLGHGGLGIKEKAGVIKIDQYYGFTIGSAASAGVLIPIWANKADIDSKSSTRFINPNNLDYALIKSLTTNVNTMTDEDKAKACEWLGALEKATTYTYVPNGREIYGVAFENGVAQQGRFPVNRGTKSTTNGAIATYFNKAYAEGALTDTEPTGVLLAGTPEKPYQVANKKYVDEEIASLTNVDTDTLKALEELAKALGENASVSEALQLAIAEKASKEELSNVASLIPAQVSQLENDRGYINKETDPTVPAWAKQANKPSYTYDEIEGTPTLSNVATSGSYNDLSNKPDLTNYYTKTQVDAKIPTKTETWTFTLEDGSTVTKAVVLK